MNRVRDGSCLVPNPFNPNQVATVSLKPEDVDAIVFWTRNPRPLMSSLRELDDRGFRYFFHFTVLGYPRIIDRYNPSLRETIAAFVDLSASIGSDRVIWRYDPIIMTNHTGVSYHLDNFDRITKSLAGYTNRCIISTVDIYRKNRKRLLQLNEEGDSIFREGDFSEGQLDLLMQGMVELCENYGIKLSSCAEQRDLQSRGIKPGKCIDASYLKEILNIEVSKRKDPGQRKKCGCVVSKDIGIYDSCLYGCQYCYAISSFERAKENYRKHDPSSPTLLSFRGERLERQQAARK